MMSCRCGVKVLIVQLRRRNKHSFKESKMISKAVSPESKTMDRILE